MRTYKYLIIGGGMTCDAAINGIRSMDPTGSIGVISAESDPPYNRPPLSKSLWKGEPLDSIWRKNGAKNVTLHLGCTASIIAPASRRVVDRGINTYSWEKLLIATGGSPRLLPFETGNIIYFRTLADYHQLRALTGKKERFAVIGGGFIGSELAAALALNGKRVVMIFPGSTLGERVFPKTLSQFVSDYFQEKGVELRPGEKVSGIEVRGDEVALKFGNQQELLADGVVAGIGLTPNIELAERAQLKVGNGIVVDEFLRTSHPDIYAAGDVANFHNPVLDKRLRVEHEDNANTMGRIAGINMAGGAQKYHHLPSFYSDMFELGYEAVGELDARLEMFADWKDPNKEGVVYYLQNGRVRGVLLWNVWGQVEAARALIAEPGAFAPDNLKGRLG